MRRSATSNPPTSKKPEKLWSRIAICAAGENALWNFGSAVYSFVQVTCHPKHKTIIGATVALGVVFLLFARLEPFAHRYEGKTLKQWVGFFARQGESVKPSADVVQAFGANAFPTLIAHVDYPPGWLLAAMKTDEIFGRPVIFVDYRDHISRKRDVAEAWAACWVIANEQEFLELLQNSTDDAFISDVVRLSTDPLTGMTMIDSIWSIRTQGSESG